MYIGQTIRKIEHRWAQHCSEKEGYMAMHRAIKKYGKENFTIEKIDEALSLDDLNKKETEYILLYNTISPNGYNLNTGSGNRRWSEESKKRMSQSHLGKKLSDDHKNNISKSVKNVFAKNPEKLKKSYKALKAVREKWVLENYHPKRGKKLSDKSRKKISEAKMGAKNPMFGKKMNEKQKEALMQGLKDHRDKAPLILCHQTGAVYKKVSDAAEAIGAARASVSNVLTGFRKSCKGYTFEYIKKDNGNE